MDQIRPRLCQLVRMNQSDPRFTKIDEVDQYSENLVNQGSPKLAKIDWTQSNEINQNEAK